LAGNLVDYSAETFHLHLLRRLLSDSRVRAALPGVPEAVEGAIQSPSTDHRQAEFRG